MTPLYPRDTVRCPKYAGNPTLPAETCVMRTFWTGAGQAKRRAAYPTCSTCPLGRLRRQKLEAGGWIWDEAAWKAKNRERNKAEIRAAHRVADPALPAVISSP